MTDKPPQERQARKSRIFAYIFAAFRHHKEDTPMKVDNTALSAQIDATAAVITGLLDKAKATALSDAAIIAGLTDANAALTTDLAAWQQDSADLTAKLKAVGDLAAA